MRSYLNVNALYTWICLDVNALYSWKCLDVNALYTWICLDAILSKCKRLVHVDMSGCKRLVHMEMSGCDLSGVTVDLTQSIQSWGDNPPLQQLHLSNCSIPENSCSGLLQALSNCRSITHLNLAKNQVGKAGMQLAQSIGAWGDNSPLEDLSLSGCSIPSDVLVNIWKSLEPCKCVASLDMSDNKIGKSAQNLAQTLHTWRDNAQLQKLNISNCSIPIAEWIELLSSLVAFKCITDIDLCKNKIGEASFQLVDTIQSWGDKAPLQKLMLEKCEIPSAASIGILKAISSCRNITHLNLAENQMGEVGMELAQSIRTLGDSPLQDLNLYRCSIPTDALVKIIESLSGLKQLTGLKFRQTTQGKSKQTKATLSHQAMNITLRNSTFVPTVLNEVLQNLSFCVDLTHVDLSYTRLHKSGSDLIKLMKSLSSNARLVHLNLHACSITTRISKSLLQTLEKCKHIEHLDMGNNSLSSNGALLAPCIREMGENLTNLVLKNCGISPDHWSQVFTGIV